MLGIENLLARFKQSLDKDASTKVAIILCIKDKLKFDLKSEEISIKGDSLRIQTSPVRKSEINLHEQELLIRIREKTGLALTKILF